MIEIAVAHLAAHEMEDAIGVLARGYRDTPLSVAIYGDDPERRLRSVTVVMGRRVAAMAAPPLAARNGEVVASREERAVAATREA
jgi:hypothetical protein